MKNFEKLLEELNPTTLEEAAKGKIIPSSGGGNEIYYAIRKSIEQDSTWPGNELTIAGIESSEGKGNNINLKVYIETDEEEFYEAEVILVPHIQKIKKSK